jgi:hypothetical protein
MKLKEIINKLEMIEGSLDDAFYSLPEYNANTDSKSYLDSARNELYCLIEELEKVKGQSTVVTPNSFAGWSEVSSKLEKEGVSDEG